MVAVESCDRDKEALPTQGDVIVMRHRRPVLCRHADLLWILDVLPGVSHQCTWGWLDRYLVFNLYVLLGVRNNVSTFY